MKFKKKYFKTMSKIKDHRVFLLFKNIKYENIMVLEKCTKKIINISEKHHKFLIV